MDESCAGASDGRADFAAGETGSAAQVEPAAAPPPAASPGCPPAVSSVSSGPSSSSSISPDRSDSCTARMILFPSTAPQYGASVQCADPVTLSSAMPTAGAKKRDEKWYGCCDPAAAVTITPRYGNREIRPRSGVTARTMAASGTTTSRSSDAPTTSMTSTGSRSAAATSSGDGPTDWRSGVGGEAGKSSSMSPSARWTACSSPDRVANRSTSLSRPWGREKSAWAAASVA
mmetsp:Transcript_15513/g.50654  ORF Transcript_15513/g.50654 Transcript_15513/m.50654 type:complete len:231 (-) Transcript_15513:388-1080(-)